MVAQPWKLSVSSHSTCSFTWNILSATSPHSHQLKIGQAGASKMDPVRASFSILTDKLSVGKGEACQRVGWVKTRILPPAASNGKETPKSGCP